MAGVGATVRYLAIGHTQSHRELVPSNQVAPIGGGDVLTSGMGPVLEGVCTWRQPAGRSNITSSSVVEGIGKSGGHESYYKTYRIEE